MQCTKSIEASSTRGLAVVLFTYHAVPYGPENCATVHELELILSVYSLFVTSEK